MKSKRFCILALRFNTDWLLVEKALNCPYWFFNDRSRQKRMAWVEYALCTRNGRLWGLFMFFFSFLFFFWLFSMLYLLTAGRGRESALSVSNDYEWFFSFHFFDNFYYSCIVSLFCCRPLRFTTLKVKRKSYSETLQEGERDFT